MSSITIGPIKEVLPFLIQTAELIANTAQELIVPIDGYIDGFSVVVQKAITTGGTLTLNAGGAVYNLQSYLDITSFPGAAQGDIPYLPALLTQTAQGVAASAPTAAGIVTLNGHGFVPGQPLKSGGTVPTGLTSGTVYYVSAYGFSANGFNLASSVANALSGVSITTSGSASTTATFQSGVQGILPVTNCQLTLASSAAVGAQASASVPLGDPTNLVVRGQVIVVTPASFATAGEVNGLITFRSNR